MTQPDPGSERSRGDPVVSDMPRGFGLTTATMVVVSSMVGSGVLTTSGYTVVAVGSNQLMLVLWVVGGAIAVCGALTLAELSAALPRTGGEYVILGEAYGPLAAFLSGWVSFVLGFAAPSAATAFAAATYLLAPADLSGRPGDLARRGVATVVILALTAAHSSGRSGSARVQGTVALLTLVLLGLLVVAGLAAGGRHTANLRDWPELTVERLEALPFALIYIAYAYSGWNGASYLAGEVADPQRRLPTAILLGTGAVVALYLGLNAVYALALPADEVRRLALRDGRDAVAPIAELAARRLFGPAWAGRLSIGIGLMLLASLSALMLTGPRVVYAMALAGQFPASGGRLSARGRTPVVATALLTALALVLLWTRSFEGNVLISGLGLTAFSMLTVGAVFVLRRTRPDLPRPFRTPGYPVVPAAYIAATALILTAAVFEDPRATLGALASILAGVPAYYLWIRVRRVA